MDIPVGTRTVPHESQADSKLVVDTHVLVGLGQKQLLALRTDHIRALRIIRSNSGRERHSAG
eukprot:12581965-Alexandrium_andersonii.AAC.1